MAESKVDADLNKTWKIEPTFNEIRVAANL